MEQMMTRKDFAEYLEVSIDVIDNLLVRLLQLLTTPAVSGTVSVSSIILRFSTMLFSRRTP